MTLVDTPIAAAAVTPERGLSALASASPRTIWGLDPVQLHTRFWASHGVQVVRQGEPSEIVKHAELYLLTDPGTMTLFKLGPLMEPPMYPNPTRSSARQQDGGQLGYGENPLTDDPGKF